MRLKNKYKFLYEIDKNDSFSRSESDKYAIS